MLNTKESKVPSVVIVNSENDVANYALDDINLLIIRFDWDNNGYLLAEKIAHLASLRCECFIVCVAESSHKDDPFDIKFADAVICVSSKEEADKVVVCLYDSCTEKSFICQDFMDFMWVMQGDVLGYFGFTEVEYYQGCLPKVASEVICVDSLQNRIGKAKKLLVCITTGLDIDGKIKIHEIGSAMEVFWSAVDSDTNIIFTVISKYAGNNVSMGVIATGL
ncbi:MAG: hypothetical protein L6407_00990 [Candidatus Delongbacteria bacterium]|nr:hypothetical protein [Candidatus Delongbacteria bacterium]